MLSIHIMKNIISTSYMMIMYWLKIFQYQNLKINTYLYFCLDLWNKWYMESIIKTRANDLNDNDVVIRNIIIFELLSIHSPLCLPSSHLFLGYKCPRSKTTTLWTYLYEIRQKWSRTNKYDVFNILNVSKIKNIYYSSWALLRVQVLN